MASAQGLDEQTIVSIRRSLAAASAGRIDDACRIASDSIAHGGDAAALHALLGSLFLGRGDAEAALPHLREANSLRPSDPMVAFNLASVLAEQRDYVAASGLVPADLGRSDANIRLDRLRGFIFQGLEDFPAAIAAYERVVASEPTDAETWNNLGNVRRCAGDFDGSIEALRRATELDSSAAPIRLNLANTLVDAGKFEEAEREFRAMGEAFPDDWRPFRELYQLYRDQGRDEEALAAIEAASRRNPADVELLLAVASQQSMMLNTAGAEATYRRIIEIEPTNPQANVGLASVFEVTNQVAELSALIPAAEAHGVEESVLNFIRAYDHRRARRFAEGLAALEHVPSNIEGARLAHLRGQLSEGAGRYDEAWEAFAAMNELHRADPSGPELRATSYRDSVRSRLEMLTPKWVEGWRQAVVDERRAPAFLVGFPRSGTTLLDTFLMGHPRISVLEEEPTLIRANEIFPDFSALPHARDDEINAARDSYFEFAASRAAVDDDHIIVDKNPLLSNALPLVHRLFPDARIIVALRHPCDVVFSCFATNFRLNHGMSNFVRLETAAELYDLTFRYFQRVQELMPIAFHTVRYEDVVSDATKELKAVVDFLELPWSDDLIDHQTTARNRGRIKTASYAQVIEPIYTRSSGRWHNYRKHLEPVLPILEPWVRKFGYEL